MARQKSGKWAPGSWTPVCSKEDTRPVWGCPFPSPAGFCVPCGVFSPRSWHPAFTPFLPVPPLQKYPIVWQGLLALKNDTAAVQLHFVSGNNVLAHRSLPAPEGGPPLRIAQRMRLEASQLEGVARRMMVSCAWRRGISLWWPCLALLPLGPGVACSSWSFGHSRADQAKECQAILSMAGHGRGDFVLGLQPKGAPVRC